MTRYPNSLDADNFAGVHFAFVTGLLKPLRYSRKVDLLKTNQRIVQLRCYWHWIKLFCSNAIKTTTDPSNLLSPNCTQRQELQNVKYSIMYTKPYSVINITDMYTERPLIKRLFLSLTNISWRNFLTLLSKFILIMSRAEAVSHLWRQAAVRFLRWWGWDTKNMAHTVRWTFFV